MSSQNIRQQMQQIRNCMSINEVERYSSIICEKIFEFVDEHPSIGSILCYYPKGNEVALLPLYERLSGMYRLYFPVTDTDNIDFYMATGISDEHFVPGRFNVMEPESRSKRFDVTSKEVDRTIAIVPGLAFDGDSKGRMGYGKGYYDRYLSGLDGLYKIGVCYDFQIHTDLPQDDEDVPMDMIITNTRTYE